MIKMSYKSSLLNEQGPRYEFPKNSAILAKMAVLAKSVGLRHVYYMQH